MFTSTKKVADIIAEIKEQVSNNYSDATILSWINEAEQELYSDVIEDYAEHVFAVADADTDAPIALSYSEGGKTITFLFEDIRTVEVKHGTGKYEEYSPTSLAYVPESSYYKINEKLGYSDPKDNDSVKVIFRRLPATKLVANIASDFLSLPDRFLKLYKYYAFAQIHLLKKEYAESNNWIQLYNAGIEDFRLWYFENKPTYGG